MTDKAGESSQTEAPVSKPLSTKEEARRLIGILSDIAAVRCVWDPVPASRKMDQIFKRNDDFLVAMTEKYKPDWSTNW